MPTKTVTHPQRMKRYKPAMEDFQPYIDDGKLKPEHPLKDGLPHNAFAIALDLNDPDSWLLPHHTPAIKKSQKGKTGDEQTVDWDRIFEAVQLISHQGVEGKRIVVSEDAVLYAARHLADHFVKAGRPLPDALAVLV